MKEECLICKAPLEYLEEGIMMECAVCHKKEMSRTRCINGHYVCNECHTRGIDTVISFCLEHHILVGSSLLTAYKNAGGETDLPFALLEMQSRGKEVPGGACGFWGACGAAISTGMFVSIVTGSTPLAKEAWGLSNLMTSCALKRIGEIGGPRCCKRNSFAIVNL